MLVLFIFYFLFSFGQGYVELVEELENILERALTLSDGQEIQPDDLAEFDNLITGPEAIEKWMLAEIEKYAEEK